MIQIFIQLNIKSTPPEESGASVGNGNGASEAIAYMDYCRTVFKLRQNRDAIQAESIARKQG